MSRLVDSSLLDHMFPLRSYPIYAFIYPITTNISFDMTLVKVGSVNREMRPIICRCSGP